MRDFFGFVFALSSLTAMGTFLWGLGSAGMNGIRYSSFGPMLVATGVLVVVAFVSAQLAGIN